MKTKNASEGYREGISLEEAISCVTEAVAPIREVETVPILESRGRILAETVKAPIDNPPFDRSPIDGYACKSADTAGASKEHPVFLKVMEEIDAGHFSDRVLESGQAVRIMTGASIPAGCDCCIRQEWTDYGEDIVAVYEEVSVHDNYCDRGEDIRTGTLLMEAGEQIGYVEIGNLAGMGYDHVSVYRRLRIALLTTGDEVMNPGNPLEPGKIYNSNRFMIEARLDDYGTPPQWVESLPDETKAVGDAVRRAADAGADIIITTGGVSVGKKDILHTVVDYLGADKIFWRVNLKPGTPIIFWIYNNVPVVSLSGNPFGAITNLELLVRPMLAKMMRKPALTVRPTEGVMCDAFPKESRERRFIRAIYRDGEVSLPKGLHSSGVLSSMRHCNCLVDIAPGTASLKPGDRVRALLL